MGGIDVLVANAGLGKWGRLEHLSVSDYDLQFNVNVKGMLIRHEDS